MDDTHADILIDGAARSRILDGIAALLIDSYVDLELATAMVEMLRARRARGEYDAVAAGSTFASLKLDEFGPVELCAAAVSAITF